MNQSGQTLLEVVTALGFILIVVSALVGFGVVAMKTAASARNQNVAARLASEEMELVRAYRDANGFSGLVSACSYGTTCCTTDGATVSTTACLGVAVASVSFVRSFTLADAGAGKAQVTARTQWTESSGSKNISFTSYLTDWR